MPPRTKGIMHEYPQQEAPALPAGGRERCCGSCVRNDGTRGVYATCHINTLCISMWITPPQREKERLTPDAELHFGN